MMSEPPGRVVLISSHDIRSKRRAGFHWLADAFQRMGWQVTFVTVGFSQLSKLRRDHRFELTRRDERNRPIELAPGLTSYVWFALFHPLNRLPAVANILLGPLFRGYGRLPLPGLEPLVAGADLLVFESTSGLMLVDRFRAWNPSARFVYRASDDLRTMRAHPVVITAEVAALPQFALISAPSAYILRVFADQPNARLQHHGLDTAAFDGEMPSPYANVDRTHAVFVGNAYLDTGFLEIAAHQKPNWEFHVIGALGPLPDAPNVIGHGELPFAETVPFVRHADVGLSTLAYRPGAESFTDSLKIQQYTYCRLPIVVPDFMASSRPNVLAYRPGDPASVRAALEAAKAFDRSSIDRSQVGSWDDLAKKLAGDIPS